MNLFDKHEVSISSFKENHTVEDVKFQIIAKKVDLDRLEKSRGGLIKMLGLSSLLSVGPSLTHTVFLSPTLSISLTLLISDNMHAFDVNMQLQYFSTPEAIIEGYYPARMDGYYRRKERQLAILSAEELKLRNQSKFISDIYSGKIELAVSGRPIPTAVMNQNLRARGYSSQLEIDSIVSKYLPLNHSLSETNDYSYLFSLPIRSLTLERAETLQQHASQTQLDLQALSTLTPEEMWLKELQTLNEKLVQLDPSFQRKGLL
jgi:hypothetical protein